MRRKGFTVVMLSCLMAVGFQAGTSQAAQIEGVIDSISGNHVIVTLQSQAPFQKGEQVDLSYGMGFMQTLLGTYRITDVTGMGITAQVVTSTVPPSRGMKVLVMRTADTVEGQAVTNLFSADYGNQAPVDVSAVQRLLKDLGYDPGDINGTVTKKTQGAIRQFQADAKLTIDGRVSHELYDALYLEANSFARFEKKSGQPQSRSEAHESLVPPASSTVQPAGEAVNLGSAFDDF